jgi:hypothetical protein
MPSTEMLKKLLEEFAVTEAHTREEITAINEQIAELERRITSSQKKLESVALDRDKIPPTCRRLLLRLIPMAAENGRKKRPSRRWRLRNRRRELRQRA